MEDDLNMDVRSKIFIWANSDLDGAVSVITLGNIFKNFDYQSVFFGKFEEHYTKWASESLEDYDKVFIIGMVLDQSLMTKIDDPRLVVISDRNEKLKAYDATLITAECSSCSKLIYNKFKKVAEIPLNIKKLIAYADDYNDYVLKYEESKYLNAIYRRMGYRNFYKFVERFWDGYDGFTNMEVNLAESFFKEIRDEVETLELYKGEYKTWKVVATFSKLSVNEIAKEIMNAHDSDIIIVINPDTKFVSFRKPTNSNADIVYMAEKLCDGGGSEYACGGQLTQKFLEFTTELTIL